jgi:NCS1 family nucleobase:cation symporter-1
MTVTAGWVMVPWKIVYSAASLLNFMTGLAVFLCPIAAIMAADYWLVKHRHIDVPALYRRHGRYRYSYGVNWRAAIALLVSLVPNLPGYVLQHDRRYSMLTKLSLANAVNSSLYISTGISHLVSIRMNPI